MNLLSIALVGFGLVAIGAGVLMATRPDQARRVERKMAEITGRVTVEKGRPPRTISVVNIILVVAVGLIAIAVGLLIWR